jgi:hypothetical protein
MADWHGHARSNYFRVTDSDAFKRWAASLHLEIWEKTKDTKTYFAMAASDVEYGGWPTQRYRDEEDDEDDEEQDDNFSFVKELSHHLQEGSVAVLMECGTEALRYVTGIAKAVNSKGETVEVNLEDIYLPAKTLGNEVTDASY